MVPVRLVALAGLVMIATGACGDTDGPAGFCGWIGIDVEGLGRIVTEDGDEWVGTWYHVLAEGVTDADQASRVAIAEAVEADSAGFERLRAEAAEPVRPALDRLHALLRDPASAAQRATDAEVLSDVALIDSQGCDFLRQDS